MLGNVRAIATIQDIPVHLHSQTNGFATSMGNAGTSVYRRDGQNPRLPSPFGKNLACTFSLGRQLTTMHFNATTRQERDAQIGRRPVLDQPTSPLDIENGDNGGPEDDSDRVREIQRIASKISTVKKVPDSDLFTNKDGGPLDPTGPKFDSRAWMTEFFRLQWQGAEAPVKTLGVAFRNLGVSGYGSATGFQQTVGNIFLDILPVFSKMTGRKEDKVQILDGFDGLLQAGEMLCVLGPPGSGCSTLLKVLAGETHGLFVDNDSQLNYKGITAKALATKYRGEASYNAEIDHHLPMLSVQDTLYVAASARASRTLPGGISRKEYAKHLADVVMAAFGIAHTRNTRVGNDVSAPCHPVRLMLTSVVR
jgi:ATP-binding cassette, subfamily G (WHITE), member 2, PDR